VQAATPVAEGVVARSCFVAEPLGGRTGFGRCSDGAVGGNPEQTRAGELILVVLPVRAAAYKSKACFEDGH
jgi:hypothetical protein